MKQYVECMEVREDFSALLDGELNPEEREQVEAHLSGCAECLRELNALKQVDDAYSALGSVSAPADFEDRVQQAIRPRVLRFPDWAVSGPGRWMRPVAALAALVLVMFGAIYLLRPAPVDTFQTAGLPESEGAELKADAPMEAAELFGESRFAAEEESILEREGTPGKPREEVEQVSATGDWDTFIRTTPDLSEVQRRAEVVESEPAQKKAESAPGPSALRDSMAGELDVQREMSTSAAPPESARAPQAPRAMAGLGSLGYVDDSEVARAVDALSMEERERLESLGYIDNVRVAPDAADSGLSIQSEVLKARNEILGIPTRRRADEDASAGGRDRFTEEPLAAGLGAGAAQSVQVIEKLIERAQVQGQALDRVQLRSFRIGADGTWIEEGYAGEATKALTRDSRALAELTVRFPEIKRMLRRPARTIFQIDGEWYLLEAEDK